MPKETSHRLVRSLGFELLDRHVIDGRGDEIACMDGNLTYAKLTERAADVAGGLRMLGVHEGDAVEIDLPPGKDAVTALCAVIRLGAVPVAGPVAGPVDVGASLKPVARIRNLNGVPHVQTHEHGAGDGVEFALVQRAGRADPAVSLKHDSPGYEEQASRAFGDTVQGLLAGTAVV